ncbi:MAG TPA: hypothetical protein VF018_11880 [Acidobacteriaceae bacterium]
MNSPLRALTACLGVLLYLCVLNATSFGVTLPGDPAPTADQSVASDQMVVIPGPLRSFLRMAAISQKVPSDKVLPLLARNVITQGYDNGRPTEFLILVDRYLHQARELQNLAAASGGSIHIADCDHSATLLQILGYRLRPGCGQKDLFLSTSDAERAFLTIDSGFPLTELEADLQKNHPFTYAFPTSSVPVLLSEKSWTTLASARDRRDPNLIDLLLHDRSVARLYWAFSRMDAETRVELAHSPGLSRLLPYGGVLDFYGSQICIRDGHLIVPGGASAEPAWKSLVGVNPASGGDFALHLVAKDNGWLAAYFDAVARVNPEQQAHLVESSRLKPLYEAFRSSDSQEQSANAAFRKAPSLLLLFTRLQWEPNGDPHVPGNLDVWKDLPKEKLDSKIIRDWNKRAHKWSHPDQLVEAMAASSRVPLDDGPLQIYLTISELDRVRPPVRYLSAPTVRLLAAKYSQFGRWYLIFSEFPQLSEESITRFINVADAVDAIPHLSLRGNTLGAFQANIGLWQILARQREIPQDKLNASWQKTLEPFAKVSSSNQLLDAAHTSLGALYFAATGKRSWSQEELVDLLAGPPQSTADGQRMHAEIAARIRSVLDDQRLVSLDTLFALSDGLQQMERGAHVGSSLVPLAEDLRGFEMPQQIFTQNEKIEWAPTIYSSRHAELQIKTDLTKTLKAPSSRAQLEVARGQLAPFVRDTLVGLNYAYYEPPGAQVLHNNPLFVRSHDFSGFSVIGAERPWQTPELFGIGTPAGGGAYLIGSLADLPYALAMTEEDFIAPENVQALIWKEVVPDLVVSATVPRWWNVSSTELHAVALYQRSGEEILSAAANDEQLRTKVLSILSDRMAPQRLAQADRDLRSKLPPHLLPGENFYVASVFREKFPEELASLGPANHELDQLRREDPSETSGTRLSSDFGTPHPILAQTNSLELLNVKPFPASGGEDSRLFGESWDSSNLYWARLADEMGYSPVMLNRLVPELTRRMVSKIFATDLEDLSAIQRAMQEAGDEFRQGKVASLPVTQEAPGH